MVYVKTHVVVRRNARGGRSAEEHLVAALRCLYQRAVDDGLIAEADNPARKVAKPRRLPTTRRALPDARLAEINQVAATTGDDPELDTLLLRLQTETACRRGGALALRPADLDPDQYLILLREKGETVRWQPVSPTLMARLVRHGQDRHAPDGGQLLRYADGRPITSRRYDHLWARIGRELSWVRTQQISTHWIRHTTLTYQFRGRHSRDPGRAAARTPDPGNARPVRPRLAADARETDSGSPGPVGRVPPAARRYRPELPGPVARQLAGAVPGRARRSPRSSATIGVLKGAPRSQKPVPQAGLSRWLRSRQLYLALAPENARSQGFGRRCAP